jgi:hypothetical protein
LKLVVFDFSLCRTPADNITAGTHPYLDPFLSLRRPPRGDLCAERFALAVTLFEMTIGKPPVWGNGQTSPDMLDVEATIASDVFDPVTREGFTAFFPKRCGAISKSALTTRKKCFAPGAPSLPPGMG